MTHERTKITPIIKWAGGKSKLYSQLRTKMPDALFNGQIKKYYEPFLGGGAVFLNIIQQVNIENCYISDINEDLILLYTVVKNDPKKIIQFVNKFLLQYGALSNNDKEKFYYDIRATYNIERFNIDYEEYSATYIPRAAQMVFLNKICYNGLYRQNMIGEFNVPFGKNYYPVLLKEDNINRLSEILKRVSVKCVDFQNICADIEGSDSFVYFDPPYKSLNKKVSFTSYHKSNFSIQDQVRLSEVFKELDKRNVLLMMNNSCVLAESGLEPVEDFYKGFTIDYISSNSTMSSIVSKRKKINELIITNY